MNSMKATVSAVAVLLALPAAAAAAERPSAPPTPDALVEQAMESGPAAVKRLVNASARDYTLANAILARATVSTTADAASGPITAAAVTPGCHGPVSSKTTISIVGINLGWRKAIVNSWCWSSSAVTSWSVTHDEWSGFGYCWKDESQTNTWLIYPTRLKYRNKGTLAGIAPWGCSGGQQTIAPSVHYERGGGWNVYAND